MRTNIKEIGFIILFTAIISLTASPMEAVIDSVWFNQEVSCNGENLVEICYVLSGEIANIGIEVSSDSGATWDAELVSITDTEGDFGEDIEPGEHCFIWDYGTDNPNSETFDWMIKASMTSFLDTFIVLDSIDINTNPQYGWGLGYGDHNFWIYNYGNGYVYKSSCITCPPGDSFYIGRLYNCDIDYDNRTLYFASSGGDPRVIEALDVRTRERDTIAIMPEYDSGVQGVHAIGDDLYFTWYGTPPNPRYLMHLDLSEPWPITEWDTLLTSVSDTCHTAEGLAYANGYLWSSNNFARMTQITLDPPEYTACYPIPNTGSGSEGLCFDGQYMWFMNGGTRKIYKIMIMDSTRANQIANAPLDSKSPDVYFYCPADTFLNGDSVTIEWTIEDMFNSSEPCSLFISYGDYADTNLVTGREFDWVIPDDILEESYVHFRIAARDSFCNWSTASCSLFVYPIWYANLQIDEFIACPGETILIPITLDSLERTGFNSIDIEITTDPNVFIPINAITDGSITTGWTSDIMEIDPMEGSIHFGFGGEASIVEHSEGNLIYLKGYIPEDASGGDFANINFNEITFNSGMPIVTGESGLIAVCVSPDVWIADLTMQAIDEDSLDDTRLSIGASSSATEMYDPGLDIIILPATPERIDAHITINDPDNPHIAGLKRDMRPVAPPQVWNIIANNDGTVRWNPAVFPDGIFILDSHIDMKNNSSASFTAGDTLTIEWLLPEIEIGGIAFNAGWNLVSLPVLPSVNASEVFEFSPVDVFGYDTADRMYYAIDNISPGIGFWVFAMHDTTINFAGYPIDSYEIPVSSGWNIIGATQSPYSADDISTIPDGTIISGPYRYETGGSYIESDELIPGSGYWLLISEDGVLQVISE